MHRQLRANAQSIAIDEVENTGWEACLMDHLSKQQARERCDFRRFQHHGAARGQRGHGFEHNLIHGPVPRGDQSGHTNWFHDRALIGRLGTKRAIKFKVFESINEALQMPCPSTDLLIAGQFLWRAHFKADGFGHIGLPGFVNFEEFFQELQTFRFAGLGPAGEGRLGRCDRCICIGLAA